MTSQDKAVTQQLLDWFALNKRDLPWRKNRTPYRVWVSEIMLQQTQVVTVIPYYHRFLSRFPTLEALANTDINSLMKAWEGLGYYARAKNMQHAAKEILTNHNGIFPGSSKELIRLKGFGDYTSSIVASICFGERAPAIDGNVLRVIARIKCINAPIQNQKTKEEIKACAQGLIPLEHPGDFNEAMMELGALICKPKQPLCNVCPIADKCDAFQSGQEHKIPVKIKRPARPHYHIAVGIIHKDDCVLIALRPEDGLLGNLWEFPGGKRKDGESLHACCEREILEETGIQVSVLEKFMSLKHAYTHFKITLHAFHCTYLSGTPEPFASQELRWVKIDDLCEFPFPKANKKLIASLQSKTTSDTLPLF